MLSGKDTNCFAKIRIRARSLTTFFRRASFLFSFSMKCRASLTVEASLVLPLFLFYMMTLLYSLEIVRFQSDVREALYQEAVRMSFVAYINRYDEGEGADESVAKQNIRNYLGSRLLPYLCVENGENGVFINVERDFLGKDNRKLSTTYTIKSFIGWLPIGEVEITDSCLVHDWTGYQKDTVWGQEQETEVYVYITPTGSKYHISENCSYLKVKIQAVNQEELEQLRNASGGIYYPCEVCQAENKGLVYLTEWGNRYHNKSDCSALKRTVYVVPLSRTGNRTACSKCG